MKVVVTSRETIKPSSPTPHHLRRVPLSFLDQIQFQVFQPAIYFYRSVVGGDIRATTLERCNKLKKSLSEILTGYYPLAGRLNDDHFIECNDEGVHYLEAQAKCKLSQVVAQPNYDELNKLLPGDLLDDAGDILLAIQVNIFECGGMAIGVLFSHKFADASSVISFINNWAAIARGDHTKMVSPKFDLAIHFPPRDVPNYSTTALTTKDKIEAKRFVFSTSVLSSLRARFAPCLSLDGTTQPSRVEALLVFIWSRFMAAVTTTTTTQDHNLGIGRSYRVFMAVNLRSKMNPPLPESYFGNLSRHASAVPSMDNTAEEDYGLVAEMREALGRIDNDYVKKLQQGNACPEGFVGGEPGDCFTVTSLYRFPIYEADFGWGRPLWMTMGKQPFKNILILLPNRSGEGIEALIYMKEDDLARLEADKDFQKLVSLACGAKDEAMFLSSL